MKLVFIYGPPAAGKLTVATELERITSLPVWDNHLSIDPFLPLFSFGTPSLDRLARMMRLEVIEEAAREGVSFIFTFVYAHPDDIDYVTPIFEAAERHGGKVCPVLLVCTPEAQLDRVVTEGRARRLKTRSPEHIREWNEKMELRSPVPGRDSLTIENTEVAPDEVARRIAAHYQLGPA